MKGEEVHKVHKVRLHTSAVSKIVLQPSQSSFQERTWHAYMNAKLPPRQESRIREMDLSDHIGS